MAFTKKRLIAIYNYLSNQEIEFTKHLAVDGQTKTLLLSVLSQTQNGGKPSIESANRLLVDLFEAEQIRKLILRMNRYNSDQNNNELESTKLDTETMQKVKAIVDDKNNSHRFIRSVLVEAVSRYYNELYSRKKS